MYDLADIGARIRNERVKKGWLISQLCELTDLSIAHISSIERGRYSFSIESLVKIAESLGLSINYLLFGIDTNADLLEQFSILTSDCNLNEATILIDNAKYLKEILRRNTK